MSEPRTLNTVEHRWERRIYCATLFPLIALMLLAFAITRSLSESWAETVDYWRK